MNNIMFVENLQNFYLVVFNCSKYILDFNDVRDKKREICMCKRHPHSFIVLWKFNKYVENVLVFDT